MSLGKILFAIVLVIALAYLAKILTEQIVILRKDVVHETIYQNTGPTHPTLKKFIEQEDL